MVKLKSAKPFVILGFCISFVVVICLLLIGWISGSYRSVTADSYKQEAEKATLSANVEQVVQALNDKQYWQVIDNRKQQKIDEAKALEAERKKKFQTQEPRHFFPPEDKLPVTDPVDSSYFNDALFLGDSLSLNRYNSATFPQATFFSAGNLSFFNYKQNFVFQSQNNVETLLEELIKATAGEFKKVYITLGINNLLAGSVGEEQREFINMIKSYYPDATIYVESLTPVARSTETGTEINNTRIKNYNQQMYNLCQELGVHYLDVGAAIMDDNGYMPENLAPGDGIHMIKEAQEKMKDYIYTHTYQPDAKEKN